MDAAGAYFGWGVNYDRIVQTPTAKHFKRLRYSTHMRWPDVVRALGQRTARIYSLLVGVRDHRTLIAHPTRARLAKEVGCSVSAVAKSLARLGAARLVRHEGRRNVDCLSGAKLANGKPRQVSANCWTVFGQPWRYRRAGRPPEGLAVSAATAAWMAEQRGWGGKRAGAGRPPKAGKPAPTQGDKSRGVAYTSLKAFKPSSQGEEDLKAADSVGCHFRPTVSFDFKGFRSRADFGAERRLARARARAQQTRFTMMQRDGAPPQAPVVETPHGLVLGAHAAKPPTHWWTRLVQEGVVPPEPVDRDVPAVNLRPPPLIPPTAAPAEQLQQMLRAYWGWLEFIGVRAKPYARNMKAADRAKLTEVAEYMAAHAMAPSLWFAWRTASWNAKNAHGAPTKAPPAWFLFRLETVAKLRGFFKASTMLPDHVVSRIVPAMRELLTRYYRVRLEAMRDGCTEQAARDAMARHLPGNTYRDLMDAAKGQASEAQQVADMHRDAGQWIWG